MIYVDEKENTRKISGIWYADNRVLDRNIESILKRCSFESDNCPINKAVKSKKANSCRA